MSSLRTVKRTDAGEGSFHGGRPPAQTLHAAYGFPISQHKLLHTFFAHSCSSELAMAMPDRRLRCGLATWCLHRRAGWKVPAGISEAHLCDTAAEICAA